MKEMVYQKTRIREILVDDYYKDYHYVILSMGTHPCGYVEVPIGHKLYNTDLSKLLEISCHGGITYAYNHLCIDSINEETDYHGWWSWWIGWDYAHCNDYMGYYIDDDKYQYFYDAKKWTTSEIVSECKDVIDQLIEMEDNGTDHENISS